MYLVFFKTVEDTHRCLFSDDHFETMKYLPENKTVHHYECFKGYDATDDGLIKFKTDIIKWNDEIKNNDVYLKIKFERVFLISDKNFLFSDNFR